MGIGAGGHGDTEQPGQLERHRFGHGQVALLVGAQADDLTIDEHLDLAHSSEVQRCRPRSGQGFGLHQFLVGVFDDGECLLIDEVGLEHPSSLLAATHGFGHPASTSGELLEVGSPPEVVTICQSPPVIALRGAQRAPGRLECIVGGGEHRLVDTRAFAHRIEALLVFGDPGGAGGDALDQCFTLSELGDRSLAPAVGVGKFRFEQLQLASLLGDGLGLRAQILEILGVLRTTLGQRPGFFGEPGHPHGVVLERPQFVQQCIDTLLSGDDGLVSFLEVLSGTAGVGEVLLAFGNDALPEVIGIGVVGTFSTGSQIECSTQGPTGEVGLGQCLTLLHPQRAPECLVHGLGNDRPEAVVGLPAGELLPRRLENLEFGHRLLDEPLGATQSVGPGAQLDLNLGAYIAPDRLHVAHCRLGGVVALGENEADGLVDRGLAHLVVALDDRDSGVGELHRAVLDAPEIGQFDVVDPHDRTPFVSRSEELLSL